MSKDLKPCPFCGSIASIGRTKKTLTHQFSAHCANSRCIANRLGNPFVMHYLSRDEAAEAWNRRVSSRTLEHALESIIWYNGHEEWLEELAGELEKTSLYTNPIDVSEWHSEKHCIWMLLVGMFGDWGTSIRGGWIDHTKECAEYIRRLCKRARGDDDEQREAD